MELIGLGFKIFYIVIPTCGLIGNTLIIMATVKYKQLRSSCNILIAAMALGDIFHQAGFVITVLLHELIEGHVLSQRKCLYAQALPLLGVYSAELLLLSVALDRLFSLHHFYKLMIATNKTMYVTCHIGASVVIPLIILVWAYVVRYENVETLCTLTAPLQGALYYVIIDFLMVVNFSVLVVYAIFLIRVRKVVVDDEGARSIYRSLTVIVVTVVMGWFSTILFASVIKPALFPNLDRNTVDFIAGMFVNLAITCDFFVYYTVSKEYRLVFNEMLHLSHIKCRTIPPSQNSGWKLGGRNSMLVSQAQRRSETISHYS